jgi:hypothetical protein
MDYHLDRRLQLLLEPEHKGLYSWAIIELDDRGQKVGLDQIPWGWRLYFTATEIVLGDQLTVKTDGVIEGRLPQQEEISHRRTIRAKLRPGDPRSDADWYRRTSYRMFGTDREIKSFLLDILPLESEDENEKCEAWGSVSYTAETDFRTETEDDIVVFYLFVKPSTFDRYAARIADGTADEVILGAGMVSGFYSEWSPSISTRDVKVLARGNEQNVEMPDGTTFEPPRLGDVGEVDLYINAKRLQAKKLPSADNAEIYVDEEQSTPLVRPEVAESRSGGWDPQMQKTLQSLKSSARWIIGLLVVLVLVTLFKR